MHLPDDSSYEQSGRCVQGIFLSYQMMDGWFLDSTFNFPVFFGCYFFPCVFFLGRFRQPFQFRSPSRDLIKESLTVGAASTFAASLLPSTALSSPAAPPLTRSGWQLPSTFTRLQFQPRLKNIGQIGSFPQVGMKIKNLWNHHLVHFWVSKVQNHS